MANRLQEDEETVKNPGQEYYDRKFNEIVENERKREGAEGNLQDLESNTSQINAKQQSTDAQERERTVPPRGAAGSWSTDIGKKTPTKTKSRFRGGAVAQIVNVARGKGGIIGITIALFMLILVIIAPNFLSFKVPGLMDFLNRFRGAAVERISDSFGRKITNQVFASSFGKKRDYVNYTNDSPLANILETEGLEKRFRDVGIEVEDAGDRGVTILFRGQEVGTGRTASDIDNVIQNAPDSISQDLDNSLSRAVFVKAWSKRIVANFVKTNFDIKRYGVDEQESDEEQEEEDNRSAEQRRLEATRRAQLEQDYGKVNSVFTEALSCFMGDGGGECSATDINRDDEQTRNEEAGAEAEEAEEAVRDTVNESSDELVDEAPEANAFGQSAGTNMIDKLTGKLIGIAGTKAIPYIGWADLAATIVVRIDQIARNDSIVEISAQAKSQLSGYMFGSWSGYGDQFKNADMSAAYMGILANQLNGAEESTAFQYASGNGVVGEEMPELYKLNLTNPEGVVNGVQSIVDNTATTILITNPALYGASYVWYYTIGWVLRTAGDAAGELAFESACQVQDIRNNIINFFGGGGFIDFVRDQDYLIADCSDIEATMTEVLKSILPKLLPLLGLGFDPLVSGPLLYNILDMGGNFSYNQFCKENGCRKLTPEQAAVQQNKALAMQQEDFLNRPLSERLFSRDTHYSAINQLAFAMPSGFGGSTVSSFASLFELPQIAALKLSSTASAASTLTAGDVPYRNLYGMEEYGATNNDLAADLPQEFFNGDECPEIDEEGDEFNHCKYAKTSADIYVAGVTGDDGTASGGTTETATDEIDLDSLYESSENIDCAAGTKDQGVHDGYRQGHKIRVRICEITNFPSSGSESNNQYGFSGVSGGLLVNSRISGVVKSIADAAAEDGVNIQATSGFRTMAHQEALWNQYGAGRAARPGTSNHQMGVAIDIDQGATLTWFEANANDYGLKQNSALPDGLNEDWHWSPTGR